MAKTKDKTVLSIDALRPYVKRAMEDPDLRDDLLAAFVAARKIYGEIARSHGVRSKAEKVSDRQVQKQLQELIDELASATERLRGETKKASHKARNRVLLLTGVTLGVLYNPWTGPATREWIMERIAGGDGGGPDEPGEETPSVGDATQEAAESAPEAAQDAASDA
ncbi:MAG: hypothetical protein KatS3mg012_0026 [Gaiellaceae bacterium]|nr:MAG: hypothetical protein KatS3mg012_0026 [Gaiellaceae bacterium]